MRKLSMVMFATLDGVMQAPGHPMEDPANGFDAGGWGMPYWGETMAQAGKEAFSAPFEMVLGGTTYDLFFANNSNQNNDGDPTPMDMAKKHVITSRTELEWDNSVPIGGDVAAEIANLKAEDGLALQLYGSWELTQALLKTDLIDEFMIWTFPVIVGNGKRLFDDGHIAQNVSLVKSEPTGNGVVLNIYKRES